MSTVKSDTNLTRKFLEFNGKSVYFLAKSGTYWVAIKPICEALGINFDRQFKNLKAHPTFSQLYAKQPMTGADGKTYKMVSLPERYIYGWIFQIRSDSKQLANYQKQCCDILYDYFHGSITSRETLIREKARAEVAKDKIIDTLRELEDFRQLQQLNDSIRKIKVQLRELDSEIQHDQLNLFQTDAQ